MPPVQRMLCLAVLALGVAVPAAPASTLQSRMARIALHEFRMGAAEVPLGSDRGPRLGRYFRAASSPAGVAWCAAFVSFVARRAGFPVGRRGRGTNSVATLGRWGMRRGLWFAPGWRRPKVGDIALFPAHTGIVVRVTRSGRIWLVDGNWSNRVSFHVPTEPPTGFLRLPDRPRDRPGGPGELVLAG